MPNVKEGDVAKTFACDDPRNNGILVCVEKAIEVCCECSGQMWKVQALCSGTFYNLGFFFSTAVEFQAGGNFDIHDKHLKPLPPPGDEVFDPVSIDLKIPSEMV